MELYRNSLLAGGKSLGTVKQRIGHIEQLRRIHQNILDITAEDLEKFLADRRTTHSAEARRSMRSSFRSFYQWTYERGFTPTNPAGKLPAIHIPRKLPRVAQDGEVQTGLVTAPLLETAMILLGRYGGLRLSEIATLHTRHREYDVLRVTGKGEKERIVPLNDELLHVLLELEQENGDGYYFPGRYGGHMHPTSVNKIITRRLGTNPHSLRHAAATSAYTNGGRNLRAVQEFLGHSSLATTERYLHINLDEIRAAADATRMRTRPLRFPDIAGQPPNRTAA